MNLKGKGAKIVLGLGLMGAGIAYYFWSRKPALQPTNVTPPRPVMLPTTGMTPTSLLSQGSQLLSTVQTLLPASVPSTSKLYGYYTPPGAHNYNSIFYKAVDGTFYIYNVNQSKTIHVGAANAGTYINSSGFVHA